MENAGLVSSEHPAGFETTKQWKDSQGKIPCSSEVPRKINPDAFPPSAAGEITGDGRLSTSALAQPILARDEQCKRPASVSKTAGFRSSSGAKPVSSDLWVLRLFPIIVDPNS